MRGKPKILVCGIACKGITPADAGKTIQSAQLLYHAWDHPRGCGENIIGTNVEYGEVRITPADAGKTAPTVLCWFCKKDHPRGCGENSKRRLKI